MLTRNKEAISLRVLKKFRIIYGSVRQQFHDIEQSCGISGSQLWLMQEISTLPGTGISALAERLSIHQSTCSQLVEKLVTRQLIIKERSKEDQRRVGLRLTEEGENLIKKAPGPAEGLLPEALNGLTVDSILALDASLEKVVAQLHIKDEMLGEHPLADL